MTRLLTTAFALSLAAAAPADAQSIAITNARVHTMTGASIDGATVIVRDGRVEAVGRGIAAPAGARVVDAAGGVVTPGFIDSATQLGLLEIDAYAGTVDRNVTNDRITAAFNVADGFNPLSTLIPVTRVEGVTRAVVRPSTGTSLIAGQGIVVHLVADNAAARIEHNPAGMWVALGEHGAALAGGARGAAMLLLREALQDARDYAANRSAFESNQRRDYALSRLDLEALVPVVQGRLPLVVEVDRASDILAALRLREEFDLRMILSGVAEGWMVAAEIARADVPVVVYPTQNIPTFESLGTSLENPGRMHAAGVQVVIGSGALDASNSAHNTRNLRFSAGIAAANGMPWEAALAAITTTPAAVWGLSDRYGRVAPGQDADLIVWSGDPLETTTLVRHVFVMGVELDLAATRHRALFERYRDREALPQSYDRP